ncbi:hypothetical protein GQ55_5G399800 [Panicum hallii var. hallii]|uniref:Uncharacterized protein n=1 Tax=Panicum hallii var. hallii TaxID=1504633 RepID=A0A2T7DNC3_9POAL|nr:hypothetical protein GQ55_5G399800 [Panicum hallii var. hallii]
MTMLFPLHGSHMPMPYGPYCNMLYSCPLWYYNSCIPPLPRYLCPDYIIYTELVISKPSPINDDRFDRRIRSAQKRKHKVIKQVCHVQNDGRLNENSDLTLDI